MRAFLLLTFWVSPSSCGDCGADYVLSWWVLSCWPKLTHHKMLHQRVVLLEVTVMSVSQPDWDWRWALEVILSKPSSQAVSPTVHCQGPCLDSVVLSPRMETPQALWVTCASARSPSQLKSCTWCSGGTTRVSVCAYCFMSCFIKSQPFWQFTLFWRIGMLGSSSKNSILSLFNL